MGASTSSSSGQVASLVATSEGREGFVPQGCGIGKSWLQARLDKALGEG